ncbi:MAG: nuclease family transposase [Clostridiaceae bacterium]|jgi:hypothetical protein|nr:nuclease family transposase [Clostridiaceae bacterium]
MLDFNYLEEESFHKQLSEDEVVKKAIEKLDIMYLDSEERELYENDLKRMRIQKADLKTAERKGESNKAIEIVMDLKIKILV